jgi:hypothetical protein
MIRVLAYTLSLVFYYRQIRSHARGDCETFRMFAKRMACTRMGAPVSYSFQLEKAKLPPRFRPSILNPNHHC